MGQLYKEAGNPKFKQFYEWMEIFLGDDEKRKARDRFMNSYQYGGIKEILRTTKFPIPPGIEPVFALLFDVERLMNQTKSSTTSTQ